MECTLHHLTVKAHGIIVRIKDSVNELRNALQLWVQVPNRLQGALERETEEKKLQQSIIIIVFTKRSLFCAGSWLITELLSKCLISRRPNKQFLYACVSVPPFSPQCSRAKLLFLLLKLFCWSAPLLLLMLVPLLRLVGFRGLQGNSGWLD